MRWIAIVLLASMSAVHADPLVDAIKRHDASDISSLRAKLPDASARCALGVAYIFRDDLTRAALYLEGCAAARIAPGVAGWVRLAVPALADRLQMSELAPVEVTTWPPGLVVSIPTVPDEVFPTPSTIWLPAGEHALLAGGTLLAMTVRARVRSAAHLVLDPAEHAPRVHPRVMVMRANDCAIYRKRHRGGACELRRRTYDDDDDDDLLFRIERRPQWYVPGFDPLTKILQSAEEL